MGLQYPNHLYTGSYTWIVIGTSQEKVWKKLKMFFKPLGCIVITESK